MLVALVRIPCKIYVANKFSDQFFPFNSIQSASISRDQVMLNGKIEISFVNKFITSVHFPVCIYPL